MDINKLSLYDEVKLISESGSKPVFHRWELTIHANNKDIKPLYIDEVEIEGNYLTNLFDILSIEATFPLGQFNYYIVPYKTKLKATIKKVPLEENTQAVGNFQRPVETLTYYATLYKDKSDILEGNKPGIDDIHKLDRTDVTKVRFQLIDPLVKVVRTISVGNIYHGMRGIDLIRFILTKYTKMASKDMSVAAIGCTVADKANTEVRNNIIIPHRTRLIDVPYLINKIAGGVYSAGLSYYLQKGQWFVFAPFDITAYETSKKGLTIVNLPANRFPEPERSYRETPTQVIIIATGNSSHKDFSESMQQNTGNAIAFVDANKIFGNFVKTENGTSNIERGKNVNEVVGELRDDGINYIAESRDRITANTFTEYMKLAEKSGGFIQDVWENSNPDLLYPGMPVKYMYVENNMPQELYGILIGAHTISMSGTRSVSNKRFGNKTTLTLFLQRKVKTSS